MAKKTGSEKKIKDNIFNTIIGAVNKKNPDVSYIDSGVYIIPTATSIDYKNAMKEISKEFELEVKTAAKNSTAFTNDIIFCYDAPFDRMKTGKKSFITFQYYFRQHVSKGFDDILEDLNHIFTDIKPKLIKHIQDEGFVVYEK